MLKQNVHPTVWDDSTGLSYIHVQTKKTYAAGTNIHFNTVLLLSAAAQRKGPVCLNIQ